MVYSPNKLVGLIVLEICYLFPIGCDCLQVAGCVIGKFFAALVGVSHLVQSAQGIVAIVGIAPAACFLCNATQGVSLVAYLLFDNSIVSDGQLGNKIRWGEVVCGLPTGLIAVTS